MNSSEELAQPEAGELREKLDALAMEALIGGETCGGESGGGETGGGETGGGETGGNAASIARLMAGLSEISQQAAALGFRQIPAEVEALRQQLALPPSPHFSAHEQLLSCLSLLQTLLEEGTGEAHPAKGNAILVKEEDPGRPAAAPDWPQPATGPSAEPKPAPPNPLLADAELVNDFLVESRDHLASLESQLLTIERTPSDTDAIHSIFRSFHTIKGLAGFLELNAIREVAHEVETLLDMARNGELLITPSTIDVILESADYLKVDIGRVEGELNGAPSGAALDPKTLIARIQRQMYIVDLEPAPPAWAAEPPHGKPVLKDPVRDGDARGLSGDPAPAEPGGAGVEEVKAGPAKAAATAESRVVKVDIGKLDFLMDVVGELVIAQSMVSHDRSAEAAVNPKLQRNLAQLTRITGEVQKTAMAMRMVPIGQLFKRSLRLVRDLMRKSDKDGDLILSGEDTEVDRNIVEELADPLMHMIRNAADHAIEPPEERIKAGKNPKGKIHLKAYHQAGSIMIEVSDDGRGLNREKILKKARERGLLTDGGALSDKEVFNLIFEPGFSTAEKITDISGRGVGMDVVRKQIQRMRGRVDIESKLGQGTTFHLKLPLTLAIIDGLIVGVGQERYIAPLYAVREMFRPAAEAVFTVEGQAEMVLVRGGLLPIVRLYQRFGIEPRSQDITQSLLVVVESETRKFCVVVDELIDTQEVVIKNLGETFRRVSGIAGGTILGDGRVGLILDVDGLFRGNAHV